MDKKLIVSSSPHMRGGTNTQKIMLDVIIALIPAGVAACILFGWNAVMLSLIHIYSASQSSDV